MKIEKILETPEVVLYLKKRNLIAQYKKCKQYLLQGYFRSVDFKMREPKKEKIYYFRINKQFRALCIVHEKELRVFAIDNHQ